MKTYRRHRCERNHRAYYTAAKCIWRKAHWITGDGPYACLSWCPSGPWPVSLTVTLWQTEEQARAAKKLIDDEACSGRCVNNHELVRLVPPSEMEP